MCRDNSRTCLLLAIPMCFLVRSTIAKYEPPASVYPARFPRGLHCHRYRVPFVPHTCSLFVVNYLVGQGGLLNEFLWLKID